ncbi:peptide-methionine (S)-S-oxide reductase MsrA [Corynebacterium aquilae]|uniref:Peptide methionine sulfoxide reductase MsrA n=1 Tax=Corynebacterium aquilae DSM 44791 TaxID=1431546 RepID=A0A1L7CIJ1_9CORY|nr:peptide-methionine (S)-S-oxide reductase MsrA [Corynebacterium aquilae]APT85681.1 hypothetical protein CAQU_12250 [Corynebacterium aquilae DSM 44791]
MGWMFGRTPEPVTKNTALKGGRHPVLENPQPHTVLGTAIDTPADETMGEVFIGIGCYWGAEKLMWNHPGVITTSVGFAGGYTPNPTYREVCTGRTGHTEIVRVLFDKNTTTLESILTAALEAHDPTQENRQGNDVGTQYRSAIYVTNPQDLDTANTLVQRYGQQLANAGFGPIRTEVKQLADTPAGAYYLAEDYHQQYLDKNPDGYCPHHGTGVCMPPA